MEPVGNGPYRHVRTVPSTLVELEANDRYYRGRPGIERIRLKLGGQATLELLSGEIDGAPWLPSPEASRLAEDPRFEVYFAFDPHQVVALYWNHRHPALADPAVRRALTLAIDRRLLIQVLDLPTTTPVLDVPPARGPEPADTEGPAERYGQPLGFDPDAARELLDSAGWRATDGGVRRRGGEELTISLFVFDQTEPIGVFVQEQLREVGVSVRVLQLDGNVVIDRMRAGEFDAAVHAFLTHFASEDVQGILGLYGPGSPIGYHNPRVMDLLERAALTNDLEVIDGIYRGLAPILEAELPVTTLHPIVWNWVVHTRVRGLMNRRRLFCPLWSSDGLWIEEEEPAGEGG
jgi:peptide/nickel transport system substrate-binding protein